MTDYHRTSVGEVLKFDRSTGLIGASNRYTVDNTLQSAYYDQYRLSYEIVHNSMEHGVCPTE